MRIGVVCEGQTDFIAIKHFLGAALNRRGITVSFVPIQPDPDNTSDGGWARVFCWLEENPPQTRITNFFDGGIFAGGLSAKQCDVLVIQMDSDILEEPSFQVFLNERGQIVNPTTTTIERGNETERLLATVSNHDTLTDADQNRHIFAPTVEASETWCVAAFNNFAGDPETLAGQELWDAFGTVLARSNGNPPQPSYGAPNKDTKRREQFCEGHKDSKFIEAQSAHFRQLVDRMEAFHTTVLLA